MAFYILVLLLFCEGLGIFSFHAILPYILVLLPCLLFLFHTLYYGEFHISFSPSAIFFGISTFLYTLSIISSANKEASIAPILLYISLYLFYLYFSSYPQKEKRTATSIYILCFIFIGAFLIFMRNKGHFPLFFIPQTEYQLITPLYYPHNHLGDFLGLGIVISFYYFITTSRLKYLIPLVLFTPFILFSFSNSAYVATLLTSLMLIVFFFKKYHANIRKMIFVFITLTIVMGIVFIGSTKGSERFPPFKVVQEYIVKAFSFYPKTIGSTRLNYFSQASTGIKKNPLMGIGPGNFTSLSKQLNRSSWEFTTDVHNLFLEIGVEAGLPTLLFFLVFIALRIRHGIVIPTLPFFIFLYLLFNFQTDYTYKIYSLLLLFIFSAAQSGIHDRNQNTAIGTFIFAGTALFLQIVIVCMLTSLILQKIGNPSSAVLFNPFNRYAYYDLLKEAAAQKNSSLVDLYTYKLHDISRVNVQSELEIINANKIVGKPQRILELLENAHRLQPLLPPSYMEQLYNLTLQYRSKNQADGLIISYILGRKKTPYFTLNKKTVQELSDLCKKTYEKACEVIK